MIDLAALGFYAWLKQALSNGLSPFSRWTYFLADFCSSGDDRHSLTD
jgi:hypothetical protein